MPPQLSRSRYEYCMNAMLDVVAGGSIVCFSVAGAACGVVGHKSPN